MELRKRKPTRLAGYDYSRPGAYFVTICTEGRKCILSRIVGTGVLDGPRLELTPHGAVAEKYLRQLNDFYENICVVDYVIMPNHIHLLLMIKEPSSKPSGTPVNGPSGTPVPTSVQNSVISRFLSTFKRFCNKEYGKNIWQSRSYDHIIRNQKDYETHLAYIAHNPSRWREDELYCETL